MTVIWSNIACRRLTHDTTFISLCGTEVDIIPRIRMAGHWLRVGLA